MKSIKGMYIPDSDEHFLTMIGEPFVEGRGTYQWKKYFFASALVKNKGFAVDIGGHVGLWSRLMAIDFARVVAFEPLPTHIECFKANITKEKNVELRELALGREQKLVTIFMPTNNTGHAHVSKTDGVPIICQKLDDQGLSEIDFIKIDVEGFELDVVLGGETTIRENKPVMIVEQKPNNAEAQGHGQWDALKLLKDWGAKEIKVMAGDHILKW
jgi:FkbM family methyltransferase